MKVRDIAIGLVVLVVIVGLVLWIKKVRTPKTPFVPVTTSDVKESITKMFNYDIPDGTPRAELKSVSGGEGFGIATRETVLVDLPDPTTGYFYQVWMEESGKLKSLGKMRPAKGGFLLDANVTGSKVVVSSEKVFDNTLETKILEGSF